MKRSKLLVSVLVLAALVAGAVIVNFTVYDFCGAIKQKFVGKAVAENKAKTPGEAKGEVAKPTDANAPKGAVGKVGAVGEPNAVSKSTGMSSRRSRERGDAYQPGVPTEGAKPPVDKIRPSDSNTPAGGDKAANIKDANAPGKAKDANAPAGVKGPNEPNVPMEAVNLKDVEMKDIIAKIADWTGKVVIPCDDVMKQKLTVYSAKKLPRPQVLSLIYTALRFRGFIAEEREGIIYLKPVKESVYGSVPLIPAEQPLALIENKNQVVQRFVKLKNYKAGDMSKVLKPLMGEFGYVSGDDATGSLQIIDSVENIMRYERIISEMDTPEAERTVTQIFTISNGDPAEIVQLLRMLLGQGPARSPRSSSSSSYSETEGRSRSMGSEMSSRSMGSDSSSSSSRGPEPVIVGTGQEPIILIPEVKKKWIIAKGAPEDIKMIGEWITKLDVTEEIKSNYETYPVTYVDVTEVAARLNEAIQQISGTELRTSVLITPLRQARQIMVFGRSEVREMVKKLLAEIDMPTGEFETKVFQLKYADPEQIKKNIDDLYGEQKSSNPYGSGDYYYYTYGPGRFRTPADTVKVIAFPTMQQVTVIASAENMVKIAKQITEWDIPIDVEKVKPRIIELKNSDPVKLATLLGKLFSEQTEGNRSFMDYYFGSSFSSRFGSQKKIVGPLYGQLTFEPVPDTKKIIVISNIPEAYKVVEGLILELDSMEVAELPLVMTLKYADAEDLCEQMNAILNEPGTRATIRRTKRGLSEMAAETKDGTRSSTTPNSTEATSASEIVPPWSGGGSGSSMIRRGAEGVTEMPISNLIGKIRVIPVQRSKALLVLAPAEYHEGIREIIDKLDQPGKQVMIKAVIVQVSHSAMTSLGVKLAGDDMAFGNLDEGALTALTKLAYSDKKVGVTFERSVGVNFQVDTLIDMLVRKAGAKVLNQPTLWAKDNEESQFFKGEKVGFIGSDTSSSEGGLRTTQFTYEDIGVTLRVRPNITPEKNVDITINLEITQLMQERINTQPVRSKLDTTTHMIVKDGESLMLGGILFKNNSKIEQKLPGIGDLPLIGPLFRHYKDLESNDELLVFITPYVVDVNSNPSSVTEHRKAKDRLDKVYEELQDEGTLDPAEELEKEHDKAACEKGQDGGRIVTSESSGCDKSAEQLSAADEAFSEMFDTGIEDHNLYAEDMEVEQKRLDADTKLRK